MRQENALACGLQAAKPNGNQHAVCDQQAQCDVKLSSRDGERSRKSSKHPPIVTASAPIPAAASSCPACARGGSISRLTLASITDYAYPQSPRQSMASRPNLRAANVNSEASFGASLGTGRTCPLDYYYQPTVFARRVDLPQMCSTSWGTIRQSGGYR